MARRSQTKPSTQVDLALGEQSRPTPLNENKRVGNRVRPPKKKTTSPRGIPSKQVTPGRGSGKSPKGMPGKRVAPGRGSGKKKQAKADNEPAPLAVKVTEASNENESPSIQSLMTHAISSGDLESPSDRNEEELRISNSPQSNVVELSRDILRQKKQDRKHAQNAHNVLGDEAAADQDFEESALLGHIESNDEENGDNPTDVFLNTHIPFCMAAIGVQGAGKSHTMGCFLESCLLSNQQLADKGILRLHQPMTTLVLHYDQSTTSVCEAAGLLVPSAKLPKAFDGVRLAKNKAVVLVSPTYYRQRKAFYGDYCDVRPLLFRWKSLTADHIKRIMRIVPEDNQLYVASFMKLLRDYQRNNQVPDFNDFLEQVKEVCNIRNQSGPLDQRIALLESMIAESKPNEKIVHDSMDLAKASAEGKCLMILDLTDPLLSKDEANSLFQVVTEQFRALQVSGGKHLALDEAHKFMDGIKSDGLSEAIVNVARLMRHDGIRLAVSTQSPKALAPELLELVSVAVLHHFHSQDWWHYIRQKLPFADDAFQRVLDLTPGNALVFAARHNLPLESEDEEGNKSGQASGCFQLSVRSRLTADFGASRTNMKG